MAAQADVTTVRERLERAGKRVRRRLVLRDFAGFLNRTALTMTALLAVGSLLLAYFFSPEYATAGTLVAGALWWGTLLAIAVARRAGVSEILGLWDQIRRSDELFVSAWDFSRQTSMTLAEALHIRRADQQLQPALTQLSRDIPIRMNRGLLFIPVVLASTILIPSAINLSTASAPDSTTGRGPAEHGRPPMPATTRVAAELQSEAERIDTEIAPPGLVGKLTDEQIRQLQQLRQSLRETARDLRQPQGQTRLDLLRQLDELARQAEAIALEDSATNPTRQRDATDWVNRLSARLRAQEQQLADAGSGPDTAPQREDELAPLERISPAPPSQATAASAAQQLLSMLQDQQPKSFNERVAMQQELKADAPATRPDAGTPSQPTQSSDAIPIPGAGAIPIPGTQIPGPPQPSASEAPSEASSEHTVSGGVEQKAPNSAPHPGSGRSPLADGNEPLSDATRTDTVAATTGKQGAVQSRERAPSGLTPSSDLMLETIQQRVATVQEQALADEQIPLTRRRQIRRYFRAVRNLLEDK